MHDSFPERRFIPSIAALTVTLTLSVAIPDAIAQGAEASDPGGVFLLAREHVRNGLDESAEPLFAEVVRLDPDAVVPRLEWAAVLLRLNRPDAAVAALEPLAERVRDLARDDPARAARWYHLRGAAAARGGADDRAVRLFERAASLAPDDLGLRVRLIGLHRALDDVTGVVPHLEALASALPGHVDVRLELGRAYLELERWDEAVGAFRDVIELAPDRPAGWNGLEEALEGAGLEGDARRVGERAGQFRDEEPVQPEEGAHP